MAVKEQRSLAAQYMAKVEEAIEMAKSLKKAMATAKATALVGIYYFSSVCLFNLSIQFWLPFNHLAFITSVYWLSSIYITSEGYEQLERSHVWVKNEQQELWFSYGRFKNAGRQNCETCRLGSEAQPVSQGQ